jgi:hypothetical protein
MRFAPCLDAFLAPRGVAHAQHDCGAWGKHNPDGSWMGTTEKAVDGIGSMLSEKNKHFPELMGFTNRLRSVTRNRWHEAATRRRNVSHAMQRMALP